MKFKLLLALFIVSSAILCGQIPKNPNKTDGAGRRQGRWTILYDQNFEPIGDSAMASYYGLKTYKDDKPVGAVEDYYKNGVVQFRGGLLADRPALILSGHCTWYHPNGKKASEGVFSNGQLNGVSIWYNTSGVKESEATFSNGAQVGEPRVFFTDGTAITSTLQSLYDSGAWLKKAGRYGEALPFIEKAFIKAKALYKQDESYVVILEELASLYYRLGRYAESAPFYEESLQIQEKASGKENEDYAITLNNLAILYDDLGNFARAESLYLESIEIRARVLGKDNASYANAVSNLANLYRQMGLYAKAIPLNMEAIDIRRRVLGPENPDYGLSINNLAVLYLDMGDYARAEPLCLEAIEIRAKALGKEHVDYAESVSNLSTLYQYQGSNAKAEVLCLEAKNIRAKALGTGHPDYALSTNNLASIYKSMGEYAKAEPLYNEAIGLWEKLYGKGHPSYAASLGGLAVLYHDLGNYSKSESLYQAILEIQQTTLGTEHPDYLQSLNNLGVHYQTVGNYSKAEPLLVQAKTSRAKILGVEHPNYASSLFNLASLYQAMKNYPASETLLLEAIELQGRILGKDNSDYANSLGSLAALYLETANYSKAEPLLIDAKEIIQTALGKEHPDYAIILNNQAELYQRMGDNLKAEALFLESMEQKLKHIAHYFPSLSEKEKQSYHASNRVFFANFDRFCLANFERNPALLAEMYNVKLATKGLLFSAANKMRTRILSSKDETLVKLFNDWQSKKDKLAQVYQMSKKEKLEKGYDESALENETNAMEKELSLKSEWFATTADKTQPIWGDVKKTLKKGEAAIEIIRTTEKIDDQYNPVYAALIITPETLANPDVVLFNNSVELENKYRRYYRNAIEKRIQDEISYLQYWVPIQSKLKNTQKVYVSADGVYNQINLNTLFNPATGKFLLDEMEVQMVSSTKDIVGKPPLHPFVVHNATLFGYPNYNDVGLLTQNENRTLTTVIKASEIKTDSAQRFLNGENINELPGTKTEIETIEALLKKKKIDTREFIFNAATEAAVKNLNNPQVLHVATHGFFLSDATLSNQAGGLINIESQKITENPLLRSGLLFAGAKNAFINSRDATGEDGVLTAYEAMNLDLDQTELVVLSACETGLGVTSNGEGVYGLQRAFQTAGSKSVLMSLWTVSDEATQKLMILFYENWLGGKRPREAFRLAQLAIRQNYPEPYFWGAFVLVGH